MRLKDAVLSREGIEVGQYFQCGFLTLNTELERSPLEGRCRDLAVRAPASCHSDISSHSSSMVQEPQCAVGHCVTCDWNSIYAVSPSLAQSIFGTELVLFINPSLLLAEDSTSEAWSPFFEERLFTLCDEFAVPTFWGAAVRELRREYLPAPGHEP